MSSIMKEPIVNARTSIDARSTVMSNKAAVSGTSANRAAVRSFAQYRYARMAKAVAQLTVAMLIAGALLLGALFGLGRIAHIGPFTPGTPQAAYDPQSWNLIVVNRWHRIPDNYPQPELTKLANGQEVDSRIYPDLQRMFDDMRAHGLNPEVTAGYRTHAMQQQIMNDKIFLYKNQGMSVKDATAQAETLVAIPGTSEHEIGLAVDLNAIGASDADANQRVYDWLAENAWQYGFILRYPDGKSDITGNQFEPWHYRYVGRDAAQAIHESGIALEEYQH